MMWTCYKHSETLLIKDMFHVDSTPVAVAGSEISLN